MATEDPPAAAQIAKAKAAPKGRAKTRPSRARNGATPRVGFSIDGEVRRKLRRLQAQMQLKTGDEVTASQAIDFAVSKQLKR